MRLLSFNGTFNRKIKSGLSLLTMHSSFLWSKQVHDTLGPLSCRENETCVRFFTTAQLCAYINNAEVYFDNEHMQNNATLDSNFVPPKYATQTQPNKL